MWKRANPNDYEMIYGILKGCNFPYLPRTLHKASEYLKNTESYILGDYGWVGLWKEQNDWFVDIAIKKNKHCKWATRKNLRGFAALLFKAGRKEINIECTTHKGRKIALSVGGVMLYNNVCKYLLTYDKYKERLGI